MNCQARHYRGQNPTDISRRWFFRDCAVGLGSVALAQLLGRRARAAEPAGDPLAPKRRRTRPRPSASSTCSWPGRRATWSCSTTSRSWRSSTARCRRPNCSRATAPRSSAPTPSCSAPSSSSPSTASAGRNCPNCCPDLAEVVDDIAIVKSMVTDAFNHAPAQILMNTGSPQFGRPSFGAWTTLRPGQRVARPARLRRVQLRQEGAERRQFQLGQRLPAHRLQRRALPQRRRPGAVPVQPAGRGRRRAARHARRRRVAQPPSARRRRRPGDRHAHQLVRDGLPDADQRPGPDGPSKEPQAVLDMYGAEPGKASFANNCLLARRLLERGVRFVQLFHEAWDQHGNLKADLKKNCHDSDQAVRRAGQGPETARTAGRHAGDLGRRVRPDADGAGRRQRRPRPPPQRLHLLAGRRRDQAGPDAGRDRTSSASTPWRTASTSTTCTRRSCTCSASTTRS